MQLAAGLRGAVGEDGQRHLTRSLERPRVEAELLSPGGRARLHPGPGEREQPRQVRGGHQVQGAAHRPAPDHGAGVERGDDGAAVTVARAQRHRGERARQVLGLHGEQPGHGRGRVGGRRRADQAERDQAQQADLTGRDHPDSVAVPTDNGTPP